MITKILSIYMFIGILFLSIMFVYSFYRGKSEFAKALGALCLSLDIYLLGYLMEINSSTLSDMLFWNMIQYLSIPFFPALWLLVSMLYTGRMKELWCWKSALIFIIPLLTFFFRLTNDYHNFYYTKIELKELGEMTLLFLTKGPLYFVQAGYVLVCLFLCTLFYYQRYIKSGNEEKIQFRLLLLASLLPYVALVFVTINLGDIGIDYTALVLPPCIFLINMVLTRYNFLEIKLMARERVFEDSHEGLIILNKALDVMDFNPASIRFFSWMNVSIKNERLDLLLENYTEVVECVREQKDRTFEFVVDGKDRFMAVTSKEICNNEEMVGILFAMEDVTERELINRKLLELSRIDEMSGLCNRRYFVEKTQAAIERAKRYGEDLSVIMMDIDKFKRINDNYGHNCGDGVIRAISDLLKSFFRGTDIIGRVGGEEFAIVMLNTRSNEAYDKAEAFRLKITQMNFEYNGNKIPVTVSLGIAELENHRQSLDELVIFADDALYRSKNNGRNQTTIYKILER